MEGSLYDSTMSSIEATAGSSGETLEGTGRSAVDDAVGKILGGAVGAGIAALLGSAVLGRLPHEVFDRHLSAALRPHGIALNRTTVARDATGVFWSVSVRTKTGLPRRIHARVPSGPDVFTPATAKSVGDRIAAYLAT